MQNLIQKASEIIKAYPIKPHQDGFFKLLGGYQDNELFHSQILSSLLKLENALSLFLEKVGIEGISMQKVKIEIEKGIENNRRIDIWIEAENYIIIIENKIHAKDQPAQIWDYHEYAKKQDKCFCVLYLTLDGKEPSFESRKTLLPSEKLIYISYRKHIQAWLEELENDNHQLFISQYLYLIRRLSGRKDHTIIQEKLMDELINYADEDFLMLEKLYKAQLALKIKLLRSFWYQLEKKLIDKKILIENSKSHFNSDNYLSLDKAIEGNFYEKEKKMRKPFGFDIEIGKFGQNQAETIFFRIETSWLENGNEIQYGIWVCEDKQNPFIAKANSFPPHGTKVIEKYTPILAKYKDFFPENIHINYYQWNLVVKTNH